jgi:hypothetical protein
MLELASTLMATAAGESAGETRGAEPLTRPWHRA